MALIGLDSKAGFLTIRGILAALGFARTVLVLRLLPIGEYGLLGVAESTRIVVTALVGLGVSEAVAREGGSESESRALGGIIASGVLVSAGLAVIGFASMLAIAAAIALVRPGTDLPSLLIIAAFVVSAERMWGLLQGSLQAMHAFNAYIGSFFWHGLSMTVITVAMTAEWGVGGYFAAQAIVTSVAVLVVMTWIVRRIVLPSRTEIWSVVRASIVRLRGVAWFAYVSKGSLIAWRRLPIITAASVLPVQTIGLVTACLDLTGKMHLAYEALLPKVLPKLSRTYRQDPGSFPAQAKRELRDAFAINFAMIAVAIVGWVLVGDLVVGADRFDGMRALMFAAIATESVLLVANVLVMCVLLPAGRVAHLGSLSLGLRLLVVPLLFAALGVGMAPQLTVFAAMSVSGLLVALVYIVAARRSLSLT